MANGNNIMITRDIALKVRETVDAGLVFGLGSAEPGRMCVEAAVCYALGLPHGDEPGCVARALRVLKIRLNDSRWSSNAARAKGLRRLALIQLGSKDTLDNTKFSCRVVDMTIRRVVPMALRAAASKNPSHAVSLETAAAECEQQGTREAARKARYAAYAAAATAAYAAADAAAYAAAYATADADAAYAAAAYAADAAYAYATADADAATDHALGQFAEWVVEILIDMQVPGVQWLDLVPVEGK